MVERDVGDVPTAADRIASQSETIAGGWEDTLADVEAMADDRSDRGFDVVTLPSGDTTPLPPDAGETDRWGLSHVIPGNRVEPFRDLYEGGEFTETGVYQRSVAGHVFMVTECIDPDAGSVILIAGAFEMREAPALVRAAVDRGKLYSHVRTLDRTYVGTFEHDDPSDFFPEPDRFYAYELSR